MFELLTGPSATYSGAEPLTTPDGRYIVVRGRLWRRSNPALSEAERQAWVTQLMAGRRGVRSALSDGDPERLRDARAAVDAAKRGLGERGPVWWTDGEPDLTRRLACNTPYAEWYAQRQEASAEAGAVLTASRAG
jgi:hypothetical protein